MQDPITVRIPIGINLFEKVNRLIFSRYKLIALVYLRIDLANLPLRSQWSPFEQVKRNYFML